MISEILLGSEKKSDKDLLVKISHCIPMSLYHCTELIHANVFLEAKNFHIFILNYLFLIKGSVSM